MAKALQPFVVVALVSGATFCVAACSDAVGSSSQPLHSETIVHMANGKVTSTNVRYLTDAQIQREQAGRAAWERGELPTQFGATGGTSTQSLVYDCDDSMSNCLGDSQGCFYSDLYLQDDWSACSYVIGNILCVYDDGGGGVLDLTSVSYPGGGNWGGKIKTYDPDGSFNGGLCTYTEQWDCEDFNSTSTCHDAGYIGQAATEVCVSGSCPDGS